MFREIRRSNQTKSITNLQLEFVRNSNHKLNDLVLDLKTVLRSDFIGFFFIVLRTMRVNTCNPLIDLVYNKLTLTQ